MDDVLGVRGDERSTITGSLDWYRGVVVNKLDGLADVDAARAMTPSGLSVLGVVKHLTIVEIHWFCITFAGEPDTLPDTGDDNSPTFAVTAEDTVPAVGAAYRAATERARQVVAGAELDALSAGEAHLRGQVSLRWILVHMLEETARHAGHLDLMREQIDGRTGD